MDTWPIGSRLTRRGILSNSPRTFQNRVLNGFAQYQIPAINLDEDTSKEAICTVFEKVNTGGVTLTVFELLTASLAADDFRLRDDWDARRRRLHSNYGVLQGVDSTNFLQAMTLLATQERRRKADERQIVSRDRL